MAHMTGSASQEIDAPLDAVWALIEDVASAPEWQKGMEAMRPLEHDDAGRPVLCDIESDPKAVVSRPQSASPTKPPPT